VLALSVPLVWWLAPGMATALLVRQNKPIARVRPETGAVFGLWVLLAGTVAAVLLPLAGLLHPLFSAREIPWDASLAVVARTWSDTVFLAVFAGGAGVLLGGGMALCAGRSRRRRAVLLAGSLVLVAMPPALSCMGVMAQASQTPPWLDFLMRSRLAVGAAEALRFFPVGVVLVMRSLGSASPEWAAAAAIHGVSLTRYLWRVLIPWILPGVVVGGLLIALLATADITAALLLTPPGGGTLPLAIFTVMANAPESLVATLCLMYVGGAALLMVIGVVLIMLSSRIRRV
jgi:ABC-type Fe3+ transport system permease subunit